MREQISKILSFLLKVTQKELRVQFRNEIRWPEWLELLEQMSFLTY